MYIVYSLSTFKTFLIYFEDIPYLLWRYRYSLSTLKKFLIYVLWRYSLSTLKTFLIYFEDIPYLLWRYSLSSLKIFLIFFEDIPWRYSLSTLKIFLIYCYILYLSLYPLDEDNWPCIRWRVHSAPGARPTGWPWWRRRGGGPARCVEPTRDLHTHIRYIKQGCGSGSGRIRKIFTGSVSYRYFGYIKL